MGGFGVLATHESYRQHLSPLKPYAGAWCETLSDVPRADVDRWVVGSLRDLRRLQGNLQGKTARNPRVDVPIVFTEHGVGLQWYPPGELTRIAAADLVAAPNQYLADRYPPSAHVVVVGTPKMDSLIRLPHRSDGGTVAVSFHWSGVNSVPMSYRAALVELAKRTTVLGHGHPRIFERRLRGYYESLGIEPVASFEEVVIRADTYVCDHSSTIYEWAALDRPVVLLDRRPALVARRTGLRYESFGDVGPHASPSDLPDVALAPDVAQVDRRAATFALYPYLGRSTERLLTILEGR